MLQKVLLTRIKNRDVFFPYIAEKKKTFSFKRGINCIVGPNASGKTTILNGLRWLGSPKAGVNEVNIPAPVDYSYSYKMIFSQDIHQDKIVWYEPQTYSRFNKDNVQNIFDGGNIELALKLSLFRCSEGESNSMYFSNWFEQYKDVLNSGPCIVVADEIENSNDYNIVQVILETFKSWTLHNKDLQILMVTHSPIVLPFADNIIELKPDYVKEAKVSYCKALQLF